jgi:hypothetical protein
MENCPAIKAAKHGWLLPLAAPGEKWIISTLSKLPLLTAANQRWLLLLIAAPGVNGELSRYQSSKAWMAAAACCPWGKMDNFHAIKAALADSCKPKMAAAADSCPWGGWMISTLSKLPLLTAANQRWLLLLIAAPGVNG